jgi:hypothetical protein
MSRESRSDYRALKSTGKVAQLHRCPDWLVREVGQGKRIFEVVEVRKILKFLPINSSEILLSLLAENTRLGISPADIEVISVRNPIRISMRN